ncbi:MAG: HK97 family phage prohead protease [Acidimicrobiales bacterium]|nr:HK97 family phage prohead protease [Acidimicrobiales bacterium]
MLCELEVTVPGMVLRAVDGEERHIEGMIAPWDKPTRVTRPIPGYESYKRGAFDRSLSEAKRPIPLMLRHTEDPAAVMVANDNREDGHYATFKVLRTRAGDDALELVREGLYTGLSVGGWAVPARTTVRRAAGGKQLIERAEMRLDHVALVREPAFDDARVMTLREFDEYDPVAAAQARRRIRQRLHVLA